MLRADEEKRGHISFCHHASVCVCGGGGGGGCGAPFSWTIKTSSSSKLYLC